MVRGCGCSTSAGEKGAGANSACWDSVRSRGASGDGLRGLGERLPGFCVGDSGGRPPLGDADNGGRAAFCWVTGDDLEGASGSASEGTECARTAVKALPTGEPEGLCAGEDMPHYWLGAQQMARLEV